MAQGRKTALAIFLTPKERQTLESWQRSTTICHGQARRAGIILLLAGGVPISRIARMVGVHAGQFTNAPRDSGKNGSLVLMINRVEAEGLFFPPEVTIHLVKIACERARHRGKIPLAVELHGAGEITH